MKICLLIVALYLEIFLSGSSSKSGHKNQRNPQNSPIPSHDEETKQGEAAQRKQEEKKWLKIRAQIGQAELEEEREMFRVSIQEEMEEESEKTWLTNRAQIGQAELEEEREMFRVSIQEEMQQTELEKERENFDEKMEERIEDRKRVEHERDETITARRNDAAVTIQTAGRKMLGRRKREKDAVLKIQAAGRGMLSRVRNTFVRSDVTVVYISPEIRLEFLHKSDKRDARNHDFNWGLVSANKRNFEYAPPMEIYQKTQCSEPVVQFRDVETIENVIGHAINQDEWKSQLQELFGQRRYKVQKLNPTMKKRRNFLIMKAGNVVLTFFEDGTEYRIFEVNGVEVGNPSRIQWSLDSSRLLITGFHIEDVRTILKNKGSDQLAEQVTGRVVMDGLKFIAKQEKVNMILTDTSSKTMEYRNRAWNSMENAKKSLPQKRWWKWACEQANEEPESLAWQTYYEIQGFKADEEQKREYFKNGGRPIISHILSFSNQD